MSLINNSCAARLLYLQPLGVRWVAVIKSRRIIKCSDPSPHADMWEHLLRSVASVSSPATAAAAATYSDRACVFLCVFHAASSVRPEHYAALIAFVTGCIKVFLTTPHVRKTPTRSFVTSAERETRICLQKPTSSILVRKKRENTTHHNVQI